MQRVTIALDNELMGEIDRLMKVRGYQNRSEAIRDLARAGIRQANETAGTTQDCVAALIYVYNHSARELSKRLTRSFHQHHDLSLTAMHVHLDHDNCLEVLVVKGKAKAVQSIAEKIISTKGVKHGRLILTTTGKGI